MLLFLKECKGDAVGLLEKDLTTTKTLLRNNPKETVHFLRMHPEQAIKILQSQFSDCMSVEEAAEILSSNGNKARLIILLLFFCAHDLD